MNYKEIINFLEVYLGKVFIPSDKQILLRYASSYVLGKGFTCLRCKGSSKVENDYRDSLEHCVFCNNNISFECMYPSEWEIMFNQHFQCTSSKEKSELLKYLLLNCRLQNLSNERIEARLKKLWSVVSKDFPLVMIL